VELSGLFQINSLQDALLNMYIYDSALSSGMNSVALVVLEDFIRPFRPNLTDQTAVRITKLMSVGIGLLCFAFVFLVANVQTILDVTFIIQ